MYKTCEISIINCAFHSFLLIFFYILMNIITDFKILVPFLELINTCRYQSWFFMECGSRQNSLGYFDICISLQLLFVFFHMSSEYFSSSSSSTRPILPISKHAVKIITSSTGLRVCNTCIVVVIKSISNYTVNEIEKSVIFINI